MSAMDGDSDCETMSQGFTEWLIVELRPEGMN